MIDSRTPLSINRYIHLTVSTALEFLLTAKPPAPGPLCAVYGDDEYLKREVLLKLRDGKEAETISGREIEWRDVHDALTTVSLFGDCADLVIVEDADKFVTEYREKLEDWVAKPQGTRTLVLSVKTWTKTTRLAKATAKSGLAVDCGVPRDNKQGRLTKFMSDAKKWLTTRALHDHGVKLERAACEEMFHLLPLSLGVLDQEVAKLALLADGETIDSCLVTANIGDWRTRQTWDMIDAMVDGRAADAMKQLDRLIGAGEEPIALLGQVAYTLRKFAAASSLVHQTEAAGRRVSLPQILLQAGFWKNKIDDAVRQLRQISRPRAEQLGRWLLEIDLAMKGHNSTAPRARIELERLIARLSQAASPQAQTTRR